MAMQEQRRPMVLHAQTGSFDEYTYTASLPTGDTTQTEVALTKFPRNSSKNTKDVLDKVKAKWTVLQDKAPSDVRIAPLIPTPEGITTRYYKLGNILQYHERNPTINPLPTLIECAGSLSYLHKQGVVHGNVCTRNFLVDSGHAYLSDIGIHEALRVDNFTTAWRYLPFTFEYKEDQWLTITITHDVHAFGMMIYELYAKHKPFPNVSDRKQSLRQIALGLPILTQPPSMPNQVWKLVQDCISNERPRPTMFDVEQNLIAIANGGQ